MRLFRSRTPRSTSEDCHPRPYWRRVTRFGRAHIQLLRRVTAPDQHRESGIERRTQKRYKARFRYSMFACDPFAPAASPVDRTPSPIASSSVRKRKLQRIRAARQSHLTVDQTARRTRKHGMQAMPRCDLPAASCFDNSKFENTFGARYRHISSSSVICASRSGGS